MASDFQNVVDQLTPEIYENMKKAVETGRWPDGRAVSDEQRATCLQAVIAWEAKHLPENERTGYMEQQCKSDVDEQLVVIKGGNQSGVEDA